MSYEIKTFSVPSSDKIHTLQGKLFIPNGEIKGLLHIVHGMTEYIDRYDHLMSFLAENGYVAFGFDNLGHGKTVRDQSELGFIAHQNGWKYLVHDCFVFANAVKSLYPSKDLILMGHSMGSFIARLAAEYKPFFYKKLIICGTSGANPLSKIGLGFAKLMRLIRGEKHVSETILNLAFSSYNKTFSDETPYEWLTKDREIIKKYSLDPLCTFKFTISAMIDLMTLLDACNSKDWYQGINKAMPILLISGDSDPVGNYGKGVTEVYNKLIEQDATATLKLYENCRHEIHNDSCKDEMFSDILSFIS
ncbi:MAG: lysophospholipase [Clostridia bacterium]|nr:lysophospholipase [Clostridia bacterium]